MPTPSEQKALAFLTSIILLGGAVRMVRAGDAPSATGAEQGALAVQAAAAESAANRPRAKKGASKQRVTLSRRHGGADTVAGVASIPFQDVRPGTSALPDPREGWVNGYPPPYPTPGGANRSSPSTPGTSHVAASTPPVDLDAASAAEIEALPRVGPALAARIVGDRDSLGAFGSLEALGRVKGIGPATRKVLAPHVTFGGRAASLTQRRRYH